MSIAMAAGKPAAHSPSWADHVTHYMSDVLAAFSQSPAGIHAFISAFTPHPDPHGATTQAGNIAAVLIIAAALASLAGWRRARSRN